MLRVFIGYDGRFDDAFIVARKSLLAHATCSEHMTIEALKMPDLCRGGLYTRPVRVVANQLYDEISQAPMATEFALTRFLAPALCEFSGVSLFCDSDFLFRADIAELMQLYDPTFAVQCVKHEQDETGTVKMDGQVQTAYARKNWSSFMLINNEHPANRALTVDLVNTARGRDLHNFCWLQDEALIGELPQEWNWLAGVTPLEKSPKAVHYTLGTPDIAGYENSAYADEWRAVLRGDDANRETRPAN